MKAKLRRHYVTAKKAVIQVINMISVIWNIVQNVEQDLMDNLEANTSKFIIRCFTIGVDAFVACTIMSIILSIFNLLVWDLSIVKSIGAGAMCGAIVFGIVTIIEVTVNTFIPAKKANANSQTQLDSKFIKRIKERAYQITNNVITMEKFALLITIISALCALKGVISWNNFAIMLTIFFMSLFAITGMYMFIKCIINGITPSKEEVDDFFDNLEIIISSKGA